MVSLLKSVLLLFYITIQCQYVIGQEMLVLQSKFLKVPDSVLVFKPVNYSHEKDYAAVYLLHGHSANYKAWSRLTNLQALSNKYNFIIICPDGLKKSWYINSPRRDSSQYESFFTEELMPEVAKKYRINQNQIFITGASMGGYGALSLFINHPHLFLSAGSTSGVVNLRHSGFKKTTLAEHFGSYSEDNKSFDDYSIVNRIQALIGKNKTFIFDCGTEDYLYKANKSLRDKCDELKIRATYIAQPGAHTGSYWSSTITQHFEFFSKQIHQK